MNRLALSSASFAVLFSLPVHAAALQAHRAYYDLTAKSIEAGNNITTVSGKLAYEMGGKLAGPGFGSVRFHTRGELTLPRELSGPAR